MTECAQSALLQLRAQALAQRMQGQDAAVRVLLESRVHAMRAARAGVPAAAAVIEHRNAAPSPLAMLLQQWPRTDARSNALPAELVEPGAESVIPLLEDARRTWRTVRARSQLRQSLAQPQDHAGPLNSGRLVLRMLDAMQAVSPEYLECLLTYLEVLVALEPMVPATVSSDVVVAPRRAPRARKRRD